MSNTVEDWAQKLVDESDYDTRLAITAWVIKNIVDHAEDPGSFRHLIYDRLGFDMDAYMPLYASGGMTISNEFDIKQMDAIRDRVVEKKIVDMKDLVGLCDEPDCYRSASCGWPSDRGYRHTCYDHMEKKDV